MRAMPPARSQDKTRSPIGRVFANMGWLVGGKGFGAICGIAYLAILTRSLGLKDFGHFSLIFGTAQALISIAGFQTWQVVVRYGSEHVHNRDWDKFGRLGMLCGMIDAVGALFGCVLAAIIFFGFSHALDLNADYVLPAFWFSCAMLWALVSAPTGIVRALHRFDMAVYVESVVPIGRLAGAVFIWWTGPSVERFLIAWALVDLIEAAAYWAMARRLCPQSVRLANLRQWRLALTENPGVERFFMVTYAGSALDAVMRSGPLLAAGALVGTKAAGLYRLASQVTQALSKFSTLLTRAVYAEVARVKVAASAAELRKLALQTTVVAGLGGALVVAVALFAGADLLVLIGGDDFGRGAAIIVPLALAASLELASVAFEPVLHSSGRARLALASRCLAALTLLGAIALLYPMKAMGIAWASAIASAAGCISMGGMALVTLRQLQREEADAADKPA